MPFGEETFTPQRTSNLKYAATDNVRQKFTSYERDNETDLDFAQERIYVYKLGRFTSVDPIIASAAASAPQTWNRYIYVGNNPINVTDPTGLVWAQKEREKYARWFDSNKEMQEAGYTAIKQSYYKTDDGTWYVLHPSLNKFETFSDETVAQLQSQIWNSAFTARVFYWSPEGMKGKERTGHLSVSFSDGNHISLFPDKSPGPSGIYFDLDFDGVAQTYDQDVKSEGAKPSEIFEIDSLPDPIGAKNYVKNFLQAPGKWRTSRNCADAVAESLQAAGLDLRNTQPKSSTPRGVLDIIKNSAGNNPNLCILPNWKSNIDKGIGIPQ